MSHRRRWLAPLIGALSLLLLHEVGLRILAGTRFMETLLSPNAGQLAAAIGAFAVLVLRLATYFLAPGLLMIAAFEGLRPRASAPAAEEQQAAEEEQEGEQSRGVA